MVSGLGQGEIYINGVEVGTVEDFQAIAKGVNETMTKHINEIMVENEAFDADDSKLTDLEALELVLQKPEVREAFLEQIDRLVRDKEELLQRQEAYKDLIKSTKEAFRFKTASFINTTVDSIVKEKLEDNIAYAVAEADLLEVVQGHINKD